MVMSATSGPVDRVRAAVAPVVAAAGLYLEDVGVARAGRRSVVRVVVDLDEDSVGSLDSDRLGDVSRAVSAALDAADPVQGEYTLEVSTPGTSRPLTELRHFRRARTRLVRLALRDGRTLTGRLVDADESELTLQDPEGTTTTVPTSDVARGTIELEFRGADEDLED